MAHRDEDDGHYKDRILDRLARSGNVAQFVSFGPGELELRYARLAGSSAPRFDSAGAAVEALLADSMDGSVNVRSFSPGGLRSRDFLYGLREAGEVLGQLHRLAAQGLYTIVNETINVEDGGVSVVCQGGVVEFSPGDTPRCVEGPDVAALSLPMARRAFEIVYGIRPELPEDEELRVEFSLHPLRCGTRRGHTLLWEAESVGRDRIEAKVHWPNRFSRAIGDKAYGLLIAHLHGLPVPRTRVIPRRLSDFMFGEPTETGERWLRTCPVEQVPGKYTTRRGWLDPFELMQHEDPSGTHLASILSQDGVEPEYSGALLTEQDGTLRLEGKAGGGEDFMQGSSRPEPLPSRVVEPVMALYRSAREQLGPVRMEWVFDGEKVWVVQLHTGVSPSQGLTIYPGEPERWNRLRVEEGLESLRELVDSARGTTEGIILVGDVGMTSHMADVLRRARLPSRIER